VTNSSRSSTHRRIIRILWIVFILGILSIVLLFSVLSTQIPSFQELENPKSVLATEIVGSDGEILGRFFHENRVPIRYDQLPQHLIDGLIATEDERYYGHSGIDGRALGRVVAKTVLQGNKSGGGGSTITQQLAKLMYDRPNLSGNKLNQIWVLFKTKLKEWITAVKLEKRYSKQEIIQMYLNKFEFLYGAHGIQSASEIYFNKATPNDLTIPESAMLVGMLKNPDLYNPKKFPERAKKRREVVLNQMKKHGKITQAQYDSMRVEPIDISKFQRRSHDEGLAPHFREELRKDAKRILKGIKKPNNEGPYDVHRDGLKIFTTIDSRHQALAEQAVDFWMPKLQKEFDAHWRGMNPWTYRGEATPEELKLRQESLTSATRQSERFMNLRDKMLGDVIDRIKTKYDYNMRNVDIERLLKEEKTGKEIQRLLRIKYIANERANKYQKILQGDLWKELKSGWTKLNAESKKQFSQKVKMEVFSYGENQTKEVTMSPLDSIKHYRRFLQVGMVVLDAKSGEILAWVGGSNFKLNKYDHVNRHNNRQVGSTFKPFLYATAIEDQGISPCQKFADVPTTIHRGQGSFGLENPWTPKNSDGEYTGEKMTLFQALKKSKNSISAALMRELGTAVPVRNLVKNLGVDVGGQGDNARVPAYPSIALGAVDLSVIEMTGAYTAFANRGVFSKPSYIRRIEDRFGNVIYRNIPVQEKVLTDKTADIMLKLLQNVASGTGAVQNIQSQVGGKTGTTNNHADGWFMGFTPEVVVGTWVGGDDRWLRFRSIKYGQGAYMARPIFVNYLQNLEKSEDLEYNIESQFIFDEEDLLDSECSLYLTGEGSDAEFNTNEETESKPLFTEDDEEEFGSEFDDIDGD